MRSLVSALLLVSVASFAAPKDFVVSDLQALEQKARKRIDAKARVPLLAVDAPALREAELVEPGRVPHYLRAFALLPDAAKPFASLVKTAIYSGAVKPEVKLAMGLRIAQLHASPYAAIHASRLLRATGRGGALAPQGAAVETPEAIAVRYAELLTQDVNGVRDADFRTLRSVFNDSQIVELTMTVCFFNYFTRMVEALNLPVESWALDPAAPKAGGTYEKPFARVALVSDVQTAAVTRAMAEMEANRSRPGGLGLGFANSQRAMLLSPAFGAAWRTYVTAVREYSEVDRETKLHVSFAVSMANGCRYCTLHQVLGLRRLNVSPTKLMQMKKDDEALTARELAAVRFARKLTSEPASVGDADYATLRKEFGEQGALELTLQTCAFAFMNRFTDGLRLPSEDEAIRTYREVYGGDF